MFWSFLAVLFSGWLYVDASYRGPRWQYRLFKLLTILLLIMHAWQAPNHTMSHLLIIAGLTAALVGDSLLLTTQLRKLWMLGAFFLSHLLYSLSFSLGGVPNLSWKVPVVLLLIGVLLIGFLWRKLHELRWPVCTLYGVTLIMVWIAIEQYLTYTAPYTLFIAIGAVLLLLANTSWLLSRYQRRFRADNVLIAACYFAGHFMVVRALWMI